MKEIPKPVYERLIRGLDGCLDELQDIKNYIISTREDDSVVKPGTPIPPIPAPEQEAFEKRMKEKDDHIKRLEGQLKAKDVKPVEAPKSSGTTTKPASTGASPGKDSKTPEAPKAS